MRLLVINDAKIFSNNGDFYANDTFPIFMKELSKYFSKVTMCSPIIEETSTGVERYNKFSSVNHGSNMEFVPSLPHDSFIDYFKKFHRAITFTPEFVKLVKRSDAALLRTNGLNIFFVAVVCNFYKKPVFPYVVGFPEHIIKTGDKYRNYTYPFILILSKIHTLCLKWLIRGGKANFFVSEYLRKELGNKQDNQHIIYTSLIKDGDISYKPVFLTKRKYRILYTGRFTHEKGLEYLINGMKKLIDECVPVELDLVGDGDSKQELESLCNKLKLKRYCRFHGFISYGEELHRIYQESDIFVLPSLSEGMGKVLLEAMAAGLPVIATNVGGIPDIIKNKENGILIPPRSPEAVADAVKTIIENNSLREKLIKNGYRFIKDHTAESQAKKLAELMYKYIDDGKNYDHFLD